MKTECILVVVALAACEVEGELGPDEFDSSTSSGEDEEEEAKVVVPRALPASGAERDEGATEDGEEEEENGELDFQTDGTGWTEVKEPCGNGSPACAPPPTARPL